MSDPVSNAEIEDVLSSIRRLVSVEDRADASGHEHSDTSDVMASDRSQTIADNRLVLTPALRVDAGETPPQADAESPADEGDADHFDADQDAPEGAPEAPALRFSHTDYDHDPQGTADETADRQNADQDDSALADDAAQVDDGPYVLDQTQAADPSQAPGLGDRIAEVEAAVAAQDDQWEPDGESDDAYAGGAVSSMAWEDYGPEPTYEDADGEGPIDEANHTAETMEDHGPQASEHADDRSRVAPVQDVDSWKTSDESEDPSLWDDDRADAIIDEEALRDMVSEIVRQELQGALGERITRNVRKLVRREIHRALNSHELD